MRRTQLYLLGPVRIERDGILLRGFESRKAQALFCYLALTNQPQTRSFLAELFWSDFPEARGRGNLNRVIYNLARVVPECLEITRQTISLATGSAIWQDTSSFEMLLAQGDPTSLANAVNLYRGDLLADLALDDCQEFEQWLAQVREHWRQRCIQALYLLIDATLNQGQLNDGLTWAKRLLQLDPWQEQAHRIMMRLFAQTGQRSAALTQFDECRRLLEEEFGIEPEEETVALYHQIRDGDGFDPIPTPTPMPPRHTGLVNNQLPVPLTSFINRIHEQAEIMAHLRDPECRLLMIGGPGGIGKSRLALHIAHQIKNAGPPSMFPHGIVFVPLVAADAANWEERGGVTPAIQALASSIADALRLALGGPEPAHTQVINALREKHLLLLLDNFEHLLAASGFLLDLLQECTGVKIMATSRVRLRLLGEQLIELRGLAVGQPTEPLSAAGAQLLFRQRAEALHVRFSDSPSERQAIERICHLLDGLPLGIELAASWMRFLPCEEIARELENNLNFLQSNRRDLPERHRSLRAVFDHSWSGLTLTEQQVLRRLSVFRGGFNRPAAHYVTGAALPLLAALVDNSLVQRTDTNEQDYSTARYALLEVVRQYAAEHLAASSEGNELHATRHAHSRYYLEWLGNQRDALRGEQQLLTLAEIHLEIENIRSAWRWAIEESEIASLGLAATSMFHFYDMRSWFQEGAAAFAQAASHCATRQDSSAACQAVWGKLLACQGWFTFHTGQHQEAGALLSQSLELLRPLADPTALIFPLNYLAAVLSYQGNYAAARQTISESLAISADHNDRYGTTVAKNILGQLAFMEGDYQEAQRSCQDSLKLARAAGNRWSMAYSLTNLGMVAAALGAYRESRAHFQESLEIRTAIGDIRGIATCLNQLGDAASAQGDYAEAEHSYLTSLKQFQEIGNRWGMAGSLIRLGYNALASGAHARATGFFREALQIAQGTHALPRMLDALAGVSAVRIDDEPALAAELVSIIAHHPYATSESRQRVAELQQRLASNPNVVVPTPPDSTRLDTLIAKILSEI